MDDEDMMMERSPRAGALGFATIAGHVGGWVNWGQAMLHDACRFTHVFQVIAPVGDPDWPDGLIQEAMPSGMRVRALSDRLAPGYAYRDLGLTEQQRSQTFNVACSFMPELKGHRDDQISTWSLRGPKYSFMSYAVLAMSQNALTRALSPDKLTKKYIDSSQRWICSQHVDEFQHRLGKRIFNDGRWRGDVTPGDLWYAGDPAIIQPAPPSVDGA